MNCPHCQTRLVRVPTAETPELDVCPSSHGLWLDAGEINFFVENYRALTAAMSPVPDSGPAAVQTASVACPRCRARMHSAMVPAVSWMACRSCHGWWLPCGSLTQLNDTYRKGTVPIRIDESSYYARAAERDASSLRLPAGPPPNSQARPDPVRLWFGVVLAGATLLLVGLLVFENTRRIMWTARWLRQPDDVFLWLVLGLVGGVGLFAYGFGVGRRKHLIESIPTSAVRSLAVGLVEVFGTAEAEGPPVTSPFSQIPCVLYSYSVEEQRESGKRSHWITIAKGTSEQSFSVRDATGAVLVHPHDAELLISTDRTYRNDWLGSLPPEASAGLKRLGIETNGWLGQKTLRCTEAFIRPGEPVYVLGTAQESPAGRDQMDNAARLYIGSQPDESFIISDRSERELLGQLRWKVLAMLYGGPAMTVTCLVVILTRYLAIGR